MQRMVKMVAGKEIETATHHFRKGYVLDVPEDEIELRSEMGFNPQLIKKPAPKAKAKK